jgi:uncharacterized protein with HEPN domain
MGASRDCGAYAAGSAIFGAKYINQGFLMYSDNMSVVPESINVSQMWVRISYCPESNLLSGDDFFYFQKPQLKSAYAVLRVSKWYAAKQGKCRIIQGYAYIQAIVTYIQDILDYVGMHESVTAAAYDKRTYDAILRKLHIMSESTQRLSPALKVAQTDVPWSKIAGFRNILVHDYIEGINPEIVISVIERDLPPLLTVFQTIYSSLESDA